MTTRATNIGSLISPFSSANRPRMISMAPRAFIPKPTAQDSRAGIPLSRAPMPQPTSLPTHAMTSTRTTSSGWKEVAKFTARPMLAKNSGAKMKEMKSLMMARVCSRRCGESPMATPMRKAPKMACTPIHSVKAAPNRAAASEKPNTPPGQLV